MRRSLLVAMTALSHTGQTFQLVQTLSPYDILRFMAQSTDVSRPAAFMAHWRILEWYPTCERSENDRFLPWITPLPHFIASMIPSQPASWTTEASVDACQTLWQSANGVENRGAATFAPLDFGAFMLPMCIRDTLPEVRQISATLQPVNRFLRIHLDTMIKCFKVALEVERGGLFRAEEEVALRDEGAVAVEPEEYAALEAEEVAALEAEENGLEVEEAAPEDRPALVRAGFIRRRWTPSADRPIFYTSRACAQIDIACAASLVCEAYANIERFPKYAPLLKSVRVLQKGRSEWVLQVPKFVARIIRAFGLGSLIKWEAAYSVEPPRRLTWQSITGFENAGEALFESIGEGSCRVTVQMTYAVPEILRPLEKSRLVQKLVSSTMRGAMERFKCCLEAERATVE